MNIKEKIFKIIGAIIVGYIVGKLTVNDIVPLSMKGEIKEFAKVMALMIIGAIFVEILYLMIFEI